MVFKSQVGSHNIPTEGNYFAKCQFQTPGIFFFETIKNAIGQAVFSQSFCSRYNCSIGPFLRPYQQVEFCHLGQVAQDLGNQAFAQETRCPGEQYGAIFVEISYHTFWKLIGRVSQKLGRKKAKPKFTLRL